MLDRHCVGDGESESGGQAQCDKVTRDYNVPLRVGLLFAILATSALGMSDSTGAQRPMLPSYLHVASQVSLDRSSLPGCSPTSSTLPSRC